MEFKVAREQFLNLLSNDNAAMIAQREEIFPEFEERRKEFSTIFKTTKRIKNGGRVDIGDLEVLTDQMLKTIPELEVLSHQIKVLRDRSETLLETYKKAMKVRSYARLYKLQEEYHKAMMLI